MKKKISIFMTLVMLLSFVQLYQYNCFAKTVSVNSINEQKMKKEDIVDIAVKDGRFNTLVTALKAAGLVDTLKGKGPFTVFAPTDDAFAKIPASTLQDLLKPENTEALKNILLYHVYPGKVTANDVTQLDGKEVTMVNGAKAKIKVENNEVFIDGAKVIITDIMAKNGVIHVIDTVMMP